VRPNQKLLLPTKGIGKFRATPLLFLSEVNFHIAKTF
jgi:hypothetical protein